MDNKFDFTKEIIEDDNFELSDILNKHNKKVYEKTKNDDIVEVSLKPKLILPKQGRLISDVANDLGDLLNKEKILFLRKSINEIVEVGDIESDEDDDSQIYTGFLPLKPSRLICLSENYVSPITERFDAWGRITNIEKSMTTELCNIILQSPQFQKKLPVIKRIFNFPIPIYSKDKSKLTFPINGYDERFSSWLPKNSVKLTNIDMSLDEAVDLISNKIYGEFCFKTEQDKVNAIAGLLTPALRGLFSKFNVRTPIFFYLANRERAGKDYCALLRELVYTGIPLIESPISTGEKYSNNDELRKKISGYLASGRTLVHFQNNRGYLDNAVLEGLATSEYYTDRLLGKNEIITFPNELDISLSGNMGISYTADFVNRCRFVRLFLDVEDANTRKFNNPDLHGFVKNNRGKILSAIYVIIKNWFNNDCPNGSLNFSSFPEWANICGGIMECAGIGNPCVQDKESLSIGGDVETKEMKELFELCYKEHGDKYIKRSDILDIIKENELFMYLDFQKMSDLTKLGIKLSKFVGRIFSEIRLELKDSSAKGSRREFKFINIENKTK